MSDEKNSKTDYLQKLQAILTDCMLGERNKHAILIVADDKSEIIEMYSANAEDEYVNAMLAAANRHLEFEAGLEGKVRIKH